MADIPEALTKLANQHREAKNALNSIIDDIENDFTTNMKNQLIGRRVKAFDPVLSSHEIGTVFDASYYSDPKPYNYDFYVTIRFDNGNLGCSSVEYIEFVDGL